MNVSVISKAKVRETTLDDLARELPYIISKVLEVPGGKLAILKPEQISLDFVQASSRDTGADIRLMVFARSNDPRTSTENELAKQILDKVVSVVSKSGEDDSVDVRLYLMEIGAANYLPGR